MVLKTHTNSPVLALKALMFPFAAGFPSLTLEPTIIRFLKITPGDVIETYRDDEFSPKPT